MKFYKNFRKIFFLKNNYFIFFFFALSIKLYSDNFNSNFYNNHGVVGLINTPTARFYDESVFGLTLYDGTPPQKITLTSNPFDWLEASIFYVNIQGLPYPGYEFQDYKDKGFNIKLKIKEQDHLPALAIGVNDIAGTGFFSSEYIVASYGIGNLDLSFGLGWGSLNENKSLKNPFRYLSDSFINRPDLIGGQGGQFELSRYFSGSTTSPFYGLSYALNEKTFLKIEKDTTKINGLFNYETPKNDFSIGIDHAVNDNFVIGASIERGNYASFKIIYKNNPTSLNKKYEYESYEHKENDNKYTKLINNLQKNGIGVNKIVETSNFLGLELTQFIHPNANVIEEIIKEASLDSGITKNIKKDLKIANLSAVSEMDKDFLSNSELIYEREKSSSFNTSTTIKFRPFLASREEFFKGAFLLENDSQYIITDSLFLSGNFKYSLWNNFDDFRYGPVDTFPAQVRSDVKEYLKNLNDGILIGRLQFDYQLTPKKNHHLMLTGGILEDMFSGYGFEYMYFKDNSNYAMGFELFDVRKRDYSWRFGTLPYSNITGSANFYLRNYGSIPFDMKLSAGEYLAGDKGITIELSRSFRNGTEFGVFASFTDVTSEEFGEGSFDKGIFFNVPIYGNFINYTWRPLTKDPGAKLNRKNNLYELLVKFRPID